MLMLSRNGVKYIQSLYHKKNAKESNVFMVEGVKLLHELLQSDFAVQNIYATKHWITENSDVKNVTEISENDLSNISKLKTPNKVVAIVEKKTKDQIPDLKNKITLVLDGIQDPGNLGTIIRTADWFGIKNIIASNDTVNVYNSKVIQSSMGSFLRINIFYTELDEFFSNNTITVFGAMLNGENINSITLIKEGLLVIGNESKGIRESVHRFIQNKIAIPKIGNAESLNAAVATGILLWQIIDGNR